MPTYDFECKSGHVHESTQEGGAKMVCVCVLDERKGRDDE